MILCMPVRVLTARRAIVEAQQAVDFRLIEHTGGLGWRFVIAFGLGAPRRSQFFVGLGWVPGIAHWISI